MDLELQMSRQPRAKTFINISVQQDLIKRCLSAEFELVDTH